MKVYQLLRKKSAWTQRRLARGKSGRTVDPHSRSAVCWCVVGAICKIYDNKWETEQDARLKLHRVIGSVSIGYWNDHRTHREVVAACKKANI